MPNFNVATRGRLHQRGQTRLRTMLDVCAPVNQETDHLVATLETRQGQGRIAIGLDLKTEYWCQVNIWERTLTRFHIFIMLKNKMMVTLTLLTQ